MQYPLGVRGWGKSLKETIGVDIELQAHVIGQFRLREPIGDDCLQIGVAPRFDEQTAAMAAAQNRHGGGCRP